MTTLLQISDAHFGTEQPPVVAALARLARVQAPQLVILSGDITQRARRRQFSAAREFVDQLGAAVLAIPGNHDIPLFNLFDRIVRPYANYRRAFGDDLEPEYTNDDVVVVGVNTTRPKRHINGEVSVSQIDRVAARLERAHPNQLRVVVIHQPVLAIRTSDEENLLVGRERAIPRWVAAGADLIVGGHIHLPYVRPLSLAYAGLPREAWTVQAGTAVSTRVRAHVSNSVNLIRCDGQQAPRRGVVERWDYTAASQEFERATIDSMTFD